jgi:hypothetical protein
MKGSVLFARRHRSVGVSRFAAPSVAAQATEPDCGEAPFPFLVFHGSVWNRTDTLVRRMNDLSLRGIPRQRRKWRSLLKSWSHCSQLLRRREWSHYSQLLRRRMSWPKRSILRQWRRSTFHPDRWCQSSSSKRLSCQFSEVLPTEALSLRSTPKPGTESLAQKAWDSIPNVAPRKSRPSLQHRSSPRAH